jgi:hypothetical protein
MRGCEPNVRYEPAAVSAVELSGFPLGMESGLASHQCSERYGADDCCGKGSLQEAYKTNFHDGAMKKSGWLHKKYSRFVNF